MRWYRRLNGIPILLIAAGVVSIAGVGLLTNNTALDLQELVAFPSVDQFDTFSCACANPDPNASPEFGMQFCDLDEFLADGVTPNPGYLGDTGAMLCSWETHVAEYGGALPANYWEGEGCDVEFWTTHSETSNPQGYAWPANYVPSSAYNDLFLTNVAISRIVVSDEDGIDDEDVLPFRGRVTSDGVSVGTATFARQPSNQNTTSDTTDETQRSTTDSDEYDMLVLDNRAPGTGRNDSPTLIKMLQMPKIKEGLPNWLARESTTALLNAAHPQVNYHFDESEVISITRNAIESETNGDDAVAIVLFNYYNSLNEGSVCPDT